MRRNSPRTIEISIRLDMADPTKPLTATQVRDFHLNGFTSVAGFLTADETRSLKQVYDEWILTERLDTTKNLRDLEAEVPELRGMDFRDRGRELAKQLLGDERWLKKDHVFWPWIQERRDRENQGQEQQSRNQ